MDDIWRYINKKFDNEKHVPQRFVDGEGSVYIARNPMYKNNIAKNNQFSDTSNDKKTVFGYKVDDKKTLCMEFEDIKLNKEVFLEIMDCVKSLSNENSNNVKVVLKNIIIGSIIFVFETSIKEYNNIRNLFDTGNLKDINGKKIISIKLFENNEKTKCEEFIQIKGNSSNIILICKKINILIDLERYNEAFLFIIESLRLSLDFYIENANDNENTINYYAEINLILGNMYYLGNGTEIDYKKSVEWYTKAADYGYAKAQNSLGYMYCYGVGVENNFKEAIKWFMKSANQNYIQAQYNLGCMYHYGQGVEVNYKKALEWYIKAATQGDSNAQNNLGYMYHEGKGVEQNYILALKWYMAAANKGNKMAQKNIYILKESTFNNTINMAKMDTNINIPEDLTHYEGFNKEN